MTTTTTNAQTVEQAYGAAGSVTAAAAAGAWRAGATKFLDGARGRLVDAINAALRRRDAFALTYVYNRHFKVQSVMADGYVYTDQYEEPGRLFVSGTGHATDATLLHIAAQLGVAELPVAVTGSPWGGCDLMPRSLYRCPACAAFFYSYAHGGAVCWACPQCPAAGRSAPAGVCVAS